jgi:indole-3-glycerol phosphate synthase
VEAHDAEEVKRALACGAKIVGVNNRNLKDFSVDFSNAMALRSLIPEDVIYVAESGISGAEDVARVAASGANAVLVGEALMRAENKPATLETFKQAARQAVGA